MKINYYEINEKAARDLASLNEKEAAIWNWVQAFTDGTVEFNEKLEEEECFADCVEEVLIWRLRFERDYFQDANEKNIQSLINGKQKYNNFISICHDIFGVNEISARLSAIDESLYSR